MTYRSWWESFQTRYLLENAGNFEIVDPAYHDGIATRTNNETINLLERFKANIKGSARGIAEIRKGKFDEIASWRPIAKTHKKDAAGNPKRALRPIISFKNAPLTFACTIVKEICRKINVGLELFAGTRVETDDIRDIVLRVEEFNKTNTCSPNDIIVITDINSMYDVITFKDVRAAFAYAANICPLDI